MNNVVLSFSGLHALNEMAIQISQLEGHEIELIAISKDTSPNNVIYIKRIVAHCLDVTIEQLESKSRVLELSDARHIAAYLVKKRNPGMALKSIGKLFGKRDHSTIINSIHVVQDMIDTKNAHFLDKLNKCINALDAPKTLKFN